MILSSLGIQPFFIGLIAAVISSVLMRPISCQLWLIQRLFEKLKLSSFLFFEFLFFVPNGHVLATCQSNQFEHASIKHLGVVSLCGFLGFISLAFDPFALVVSAT